MKSTKKTGKSLDFIQDASDESSLVAQLHTLYEERQRIFETIGVTDTDKLIAMFESMQRQLAALYAEKDEGDFP